MKVTLDISQLLADGEITQQEFDKLLKLSASTTGSLAFNVLIGFGVIAVSSGLVALFPTAETSLMLGITLSLLGLALQILENKRWGILAVIITLIGSLLFAASYIVLAQGSVESFLLVSTIFTLGSIAAKSGLLASLAILSLSSTLGAKTGYMHASYFLCIEKPALTIEAFSILAVVLFGVSKALAPPYERLALIASRTSVFLVNFGFWIGSLWGDRQHHEQTVFAPELFSIAWAVALFGLGAWGAVRNRRWVVNVAAVFGGIHFYTQWFERLGASPASILIAGVLAIAGAMAMKSFNSYLQKERQGA